MFVRLPVIVIALLMAAVMPGAAVASSHAASSQSLQISPTVVELKADPGQQLTFDIRIGNISDGPLVVRSRADDFVAAGESGEPKILLDEGETSPYSLKAWLQAVPSIELVPGEIKTVTVKMTVPRTASPGGHYGVVRFTGLPPELEESGVSLSASIGTLILVNISGDVKDQVDFAFFGVSKPVKNKDKTTCGEKHGTMFEAGPLCFIERIQNSGNIHAKPTGKIEVTNIFGRKVASVNVNADPARNVLPSSIRKFEQQVSKKFWFGRYSATANLTYGDGKALTKSIVFWVIPWKLLALLFVLLLTLGYLLHKSVMRYNRRIIEKARRS
jgi:hypothetical protein